MKMSHTPGPWTFDENNGNPLVKHKWGYVARVFSADSTIQGCSSLGPQADIAIANARLLSAAPDMLAALKAISGPGFDDPESWRLVVEAIDKAEPDLEWLAKTPLDTPPEPA